MLAVRHGNNPLTPTSKYRKEKRARTTCRVPHNKVRGGIPGADPHSTQTAADTHACTHGHAYMRTRSRTHVQSRMCVHRPHVYTRSRTHVCAHTQ